MIIINSILLSRTMNRRIGQKENNGKINVVKIYIDVGVWEKERDKERCSNGFVIAFILIGSSRWMLWWIRFGIVRDDVSRTRELELSGCSFVRRDDSWSFLECAIPLFFILLHYWCCVGIVVVVVVIMAVVVVDIVCHYYEKNNRAIRLHWMWGRRRRPKTKYMYNSVSVSSSVRKCIYVLSAYVFVQH